MKKSPDPSEMSERERAEWHDSRSREPKRGRSFKRPSRTTADAHLSVRLSVHQVARLRQLAHSESRSVSALVREIVEEELNRRLPIPSPTGNMVTATSSFVGPAMQLTGSAIPQGRIESEILRIA